MVAYAELPELIGRLKLATIDAYMQRLGNDFWGLRDGRYEVSGGDGTWVSRPGPDGEGGGDWHGQGLFSGWLDDGKDREFREAFDAIRGRIDAAVEPFLQLPEPDDIATQVEKARQVSRKLSGTVNVSGVGQTGAGVIPGNLDLILENSDHMGGLSIGAFKSRFVSQLGAAIGGQHVISTLVGSVLESERGIWEDARQNVADIVEAARAAAQAIADKEGAVDWKAVLKVSGWAVKGVGLFFPGAKAVVDGLGLGITILDGSIPAPETATVRAETAEEVLTDLESALQKLADQIEAEEVAMRDNLQQNLGNIRADRSSYDLTLPLIVDEQPGDVEFSVSTELITEITQIYMPAIREELHAAGSELILTSFSVVARDPRLGIGSQGPSASWSEMRYLLYELIRDLSWEVDKGAENLDLLLRDVVGMEEVTAQDLAGMRETIEGGSVYDPWDDPSPTPPPYVRGGPTPF